MKAQIFPKRALALSLTLAVLGLLFAGCKTTPKIDWNTRVGTYTYDQAVMELGPPDKYSTLSDGKMVADWIKRISTGSVSFGFGTGFYGGGVGVSQTTPTGYRENILRLTFGTDGKLVTWWKNY